MYPSDMDETATSKDRRRLPLEILHCIAKVAPRETWPELLLVKQFRHVILSRQYAFRTIHMMQETYHAGDPEDHVAKAVADLSFPQYLRYLTIYVHRYEYEMLRERPFRALSPNDYQHFTLKRCGLRNVAVCAILCNEYATSDRSLEGARSDMLYYWSLSLM